jgi:MFS family permease
MLAALITSWALFLGLALIMLGNGLQGSLLALRASMEGFGTGITGMVMTGYYIGFLLGSVLAPQIVRRVGHIRVFAALAALASVAALLHSLWVVPTGWMALRVLTGFAYAGLYVVAESWLNARSSNEDRGQILSIYMVIVLGGLAAGQLLLNVADPRGFELFILIALLVSLALVPISLTTMAAPAFGEARSLSLIALYRIAPLGVLGCGLTGLAHGAFFGMGVIYARNAGLSIAEISVFMALASVGGMLMQWPIGRLSDRMDRRRVIALVAFGAAGVSVFGVAAAYLPAVFLLVVVGVFGGLSLPLYSLCIAHTNDHLETEQMVAASGGLMLTGGLGAIAGPLSAAGALAAFGTHGFFICLAVAHLAIGTVALMHRRAREDVEQPAPFVAVASRAGAGAALLTQRTVRDHMDRDIARMSGGRR